MGSMLTRRLLPGRPPLLRGMLLLASALAFTACDPPKKPAVAPQKGVAKQNSAKAEGGVVDGKALAKIGDRVITLEEFEKRLAQQSAFARGRYNSLQRKKEFLDSLVRFELLAMDAEKKGFGSDPEVELARKQALVKALTAKEIRGLVKLEDITDADIKAYYDEHIVEFDKPAEVRASHLLLETEAAANALAKEIQQKLDATPRKARQVFAEYVRQHSKDKATNRFGGDLQFFGKPGDALVRRGADQPQVPPAVANAAFDLEQVGAISAPVKTSQGWHIVQKTGFRRPYKRELSDVRTSIRNKLFRVKKGKAMETYVQSLKDGVHIEIDDKVLGIAKVKAGDGPAPSIQPPMFNRKGPLQKPRPLPGFGTARPGKPKLPPAPPKGTK